MERESNEIEKPIKTDRTNSKDSLEYISNLITVIDRFDKISLENGRD